MKSGMQVIMIFNLTIFSYISYIWLKFKSYQLMLVFFQRPFLKSVLATVLFFLFYIKKRRRGGGFILQSRLYSLYCKFIFKSLEFYSHNINLHLGLKCLCCKSIFKSLWTKTNWVRVLEFRSHNMYLHLDIKCFLKIFQVGSRVCFHPPNL